MFEVGDLVRGTKEADKHYGVTTSSMTKGVVKSVDGEEITVKVLEHSGGMNGTYLVDSAYFEKIGYIEPFSREKFLEALKDSKTKAVEYLRDADLSDADLSDADLSDANLSGANLSGANLSQAKGLLDAINYLEANFERTENGYIVYKTFGAYNNPPESWKIKDGNIIEEVCNTDRTRNCGCGINVATLDWVKKDNQSKRDVYKLLIKFEWLAGVVVPYHTDGKIRCSRAQIIEKVR